MTVTYQRKRLADFAAAARLSSELAERERWPRERLARFQQQRLDELVRHAITHSLFYRERIDRPTGPVELGRLPTLEKATMMEHFDELVTDPRLRRDELLAHVETLTGDALHLGRYRVMTTSGSSGRKGLFVYDRPAWRALIAQFLRYNAMVGVRPRLPRRLRVAALGAASPSHMSRRVTQTVDVGLHRVLSLPVTLPLTRLVEQLNGFQPQFMNAYPSVAVLLAEEQLAGRLRISPERMSTSSELRTPAMTARIQEAFGVRPFDLYGTTEGLWGAECDQRTGIHLFEDMTIVENVDEDGRPVPDGQPGSRLLITSLVQPHPAADPPRGRRRGDARPATRARAGARCGASARSRDAATTCSSCPAPAPRPSPSTRCSSRSSPATATWSSSKSYRKARGCGCSSSPAARRRRSRRGYARRSSSACATSASPSRPSRSNGFPRSRASRAASSRSSSPTAPPAETASHLMKHTASPR